MFYLQELNPKSPHVDHNMPADVNSDHCHDAKLFPYRLSFLTVFHLRARAVEERSGGISGVSFRWLQLSYHHYCVPLQEGVTSKTSSSGLGSIPKD